MSAPESLDEALRDGWGEEPSGIECDFAGHSWIAAGGGLEICGLCETERWADNESVIELVPERVRRWYGRVA